MKIITLCGANSVGKTTSIKYFVAKVLTEQPAASIYLYKNISAGEVLASIEDSKNNVRKGRIYRDFAIVLNIKGVIIGITTFGDTYDILKEKFKIFARFNCDICFCASHPYKKIQDYLSELAKDEKNLIIINKSASKNPTEFDEENQKTAEALYAELLINI